MSPGFSDAGTVFMPDMAARVESQPSPEPPAYTVWQIKASTLCDLRCRYCYEWERLADPRRLTLDQWRRVLEVAQEYRRLRSSRNKLTSRVLFVWHGGEPLLLPPAYVRDVLALQRDVLGTASLARGHYVNAVQTNLSRATETLDLMALSGFLISVSMDFAPGVRVDLGGRETEARTLRNLERLLARHLTCGIALVLGRHNYERLPEFHDHLESLGVAWLRIIPLFKPPAKAPGVGLELRHDEVVAALLRLFVHRIQNQKKLPVQPLDRILRAVISRRANVPVTPRNRRRQGEIRLVVHPDGTLTNEAGTTQPDSVLGNIFTQTAREILRSSAYRDSLDRDDALRARHCPQCQYREACDGRPLFEFPHEFDSGPCPIESKLLAAVDEYVERMTQRDSGELAI